jgi:hypothetical protein
VVITQERAHVVDVTISHEDGGNLIEGHRSKAEKYTPLLQTPTTKIRVDARKVLPTVIGSREAWPKNTLESLKDLQITDRSSYITITITVPWHSIEFYHSFLHCDARIR